MVKAKTFASLFSGGGGADLGAIAAGLVPIWGVEYDENIAACYRANIGYIIVSDVSDVDFSLLPRPDVLHASPVCKNFSNAKSNGEESDDDLRSADAVCRAISTLRPSVVTLENVFQYRGSTSFKNILKCLKDQGYQTDYWHLNAADWGVPQTRKRLILVAALDFKPYRPQPTHDKKNYGGFSDIKRWVGWYEAIEDLTPTLPESKFANWQMTRLPKHLTDVLIGGGNRSQSFLDFAKEHRPDTPGKRLREQPSQAVSATASGDMRAFLVDGKLGNYSSNMTVRDGDERFIAVTTSHNQRDLKGFIVNTREQHAGGDVTAVEGDKPVYGLVASSSPSRHKAFLVNSAFPASNGKKHYEDIEPSFTVDTTTESHAKAFLVNESSTMEIRPAHAPAATQVANGRNGGQGQRAWLDSGRVVKMTPRALARFQSFPDSYILPEKTRLACEIIGNAVPCLLYQRVIEAQVDLFK